jgi:phosphatidylinositol kinase/protein kinase (PI-3  family)
MKRIRSKLEGDDFGVTHRMSISEQVARTIEQATSVDNLCLMYEGWTSWV